MKISGILRRKALSLLDAAAQLNTQAEGPEKAKGIFPETLRKKALIFEQVAVTLSLLDAQKFSVRAEQLIELAVFLEVAGE